MPGAQDCQYAIICVRNNRRINMLGRIGMVVNRPIPPSFKETPRSGHYVGQHERQRCPPGVRARCLDCSDEHPTGIVKVEPQRPPTPPNTRDKSIRATVGHHKVGPEDGCTYQRPQNQNLDVLLIGAFDYHLPNLR
jgi:hypothetical protein